MRKSLLSLSTTFLPESNRRRVGAAFALSIALSSASAGAQPDPGTTTPPENGSPASTPSAPSANQLVVVTTPAGALLSLDGQVIGPAPHTFANIASGDHVVQAVWTDGKTRTSVVKVQPGASAAVHLASESELRVGDSEEPEPGARPRRELAGYVGGVLGARYGVRDYLASEFILAFEVGKGSVGFALDLGFGSGTLVSPCLSLQFPIALASRYGLYLEPGALIGPELDFGVGTALWARINPRLRFRWDISSNASIVGDLISADIIPFGVDLESGSTASGFVVAWDSLVGAHYRY